MGSDDVRENVMTLLKRLGRDAETRQFVQDLLADLIGVDTTMRADLQSMKEAEEACFEKIAAAATAAWGDEARVERASIPADIAEDPAYTFPYFTADEDNSTGLPAQKVYQDRHNLLVTIPAPNPRTDAPLLHMNAHVDIVKPWLPARVQDDIVYGRGACDDKGQCVAIVLAMRMLKAVADELGLRPARDLTCQFVVEEETGGNGSLALAREDQSLPFDTIVVCEPTELRLHPANRGAVWYELTLKRGGHGEISLLELAAECVLALEREGRKLYEESEHPLFPSRPVQTCHGILGPWGSHPSGVNAVVGFCLVPAEGGKNDQLMRVVKPVVDEAISAYVDRYGDKTTEPDPDNPSRNKVLRHYDMQCGREDLWIGVYGKSGHMGSTPLLDNAITKAAYLIHHLMEKRDELAEQAEIESFKFCLAEAPPQSAQAPPTPEDPEVERRPCTDAAEEHLVLEGGQGFVPTHDIAEVTERMRAAVLQALEAYCKKWFAQDTPDTDIATITFDKLHNNAYARSPESEAMQAALKAARETGLYQGEQIEGWKVSCDARLFADHRPDAQVITFGAGSLSHAHSEKEQVKISDIINVAQTLALFALEYVGTA